MASEFDGRIQLKTLQNSIFRWQKLIRPWKDTALLSIIANGEESSRLDLQNLDLIKTAQSNHGVKFELKRVQGKGTISLPSLESLIIFKLNMINSSKKVNY